MPMNLKCTDSVADGTPSPGASPHPPTPPPLAASHQSPMTRSNRLPSTRRPLKTSTSSSSIPPSYTLSPTSPRILSSTSNSRTAFCQISREADRHSRAEDGVMICVMAPESLISPRWASVRDHGPRRENGDRILTTQQEALGALQKGYGGHRSQRHQRFD